MARYELFGWRKSVRVEELLEESDEPISLASAIETHQQEYDGLEVIENTDGESVILKAWCKEVADELREYRQRAEGAEGE